MTRRLTSTAALAVLLCACGDDPPPRGLAWEIAFADAALRTRAAVVEATIRRGGCAGETVFAAEIRSGGGMGDTPVLPRGAWGFAARARDASCVWFAEGCVRVELPSDEKVIVELAPSVESMACAAERCVDGDCRIPSDGGGVDGDVDGGACASTETACDDARDEDCDRRTDCHDTDCASAIACASCSTITCTGCTICRDGTCVDAPEGEACAGGICAFGTCCQGCIGSLACEPGTDPAQCGIAGETCEMCPPCHRCTAGTCAPVEDGVACAEGGTCRSGTCCVGCWDATGCHDGTERIACGVPGGFCTGCGACEACAGGSCMPCTTLGLACCPDSSCMPMEACPAM